MRKLQEKVVRYFCDRPANFPVGRPYNCCESVPLALIEHLDVGSELIPKLRTAIGTGVDKDRGLCYKYLIPFSGEGK